MSQAQSAKAIRWGILGTAKIARDQVIPAIRASRNGQVIAVGSRDATKGQAYASDLNIPRIHGSYEALLADPDIDAIYNPLPNDGHTPWTIAALKAGKHVLVEKPFALTVADAQAMIAAARDSGHWLAEAFMYRFHPQHVPVRDMVQRGVLGELSIVRSAFTYSMSKAETTNVRLKPELGGGGLWDIGCYCVNSIRFVTGQEPDWVSGSAMIGAISGVDEAFVGILHFPSGLLTHFECGMRAYARNEYVITGSDGQLHMLRAFRPDAELGQIVFSHDDQTETITVPAINQYVPMVEDFADAILNNRPPRFDLEDSLQNTRVLVALLESSRIGQTMRLTD